MFSKNKDNELIAMSANEKAPSPFVASSSQPEGANQHDGLDDWTVPEYIKKHPFFVDVGSGTMVEALKKLDSKMKEMNLESLISTKKRDMFGRQIDVGFIGVYDHNGTPEVVIEAGKYWNFSLTRRYVGTYSLTSNVDILGLTMAQVGQGEALVVQDPQNRVFIIRNGGFAAYGAQGRFRVLAIVDTLDLGDVNAVKESGTNQILGWKKEVKVKEEGSLISVATFLNVPANNIVIVQKGDHLISLGAGQHVITNPSTTFRGFYSLCERQHTFKTKPAYTIEGVPVILNLNLRYRVQDPLKLTKNYEDPLQAIVNPSQTVVNSVVSRLSYQQFMRARKISGDVPDDQFVPWIEAFKSECLRELSEQAVNYGIIVESFDIMDRELEGALGKDLERQAEKVLQNQVEATQVELRNQIKAEEARGVLQVERVKADAAKTLADTEFYTSTRKADAAYYLAMKEAASKAEASALIAQQEAKNIVCIAEARKQEIEMQGSAWAAVPTGHAQIMQQLLLDVEKRRVLPSSTVWFEGNASGQGVRDGFEVAKGVSLAYK
jgi:regulator of protease activity HflC (stomatin/prohibitin superfamily)